MTTTSAQRGAATRAARRAHEANIARLTAQLEIARKVADLFKTEWEAAFPEAVECHDELSNAWNGAHDAVTALEFEIRHAQRAWDTRNNDPVLAALVAANID